MDDYKKNFQQFADKEAKGSSELYAYLSIRVIEDLELLDIIDKIPASQPKPNLFFASIQYLLTKSDAPLRNYYPSLTENPLPFDECFEPFKEFVLTHKEQLLDLFHTKLVQTNEVRRAAYLYPTFLDIQKNTNKPLTLIEIGTSAGLLLCLDAYNYEYKEDNQSFRVDNFDNSITIQSENKGGNLPNTINVDLKIEKRIGIDLNIVDLSNREEFEWMLALIWPEHQERRKQFVAASKIANAVEKEMYEGDLLELLPNIIQSNSPENQIVLFHTHVANQFPAQLKNDFKALLNKMSYTRSIYHVYNNMYDLNLHQEHLENGKVVSKKTFLKPDGHGRWFYWN
ncbi:DUF2332 domain-containing protein [Ureibacillus chungkukjangi]|uniref:Uncharacterized protein DUF2332 n=1 Tax=Ureibacillus chungkukjangi TaxID=1202712 RepID=A0A318TM20_9BACL|nr:DUF2332 domain-containing protein [Ureibacillus chungkukjangi]PYF05704.1 uncharacterized protein DUF2332 [Ureibacillus chungkukjangi]